MSLLLALVVAIALLAILYGQQRTARLRAELVVRACHEVRGPLGAAHLALHGLARQGVDTGPIEDELWRAARALADLDAAPAGTRALDAPEAVDLAALVRRQVGAWQAAAAGHGCTLSLRSCPSTATVHGDRLRLAQITANLVGNALEHGGGRVEVAVSVGADRVTVEVTDEGPGLPAPLPTLTGRATGGRGRRGRGLAIATEIAARHGGAVATAPASRGARLVLELPRSGAAPVAAGAPGR